MALKEERLAEVVEITPIGKLNKPMPKKDVAPSNLTKEEGRMTLRAASGAGFVPADKGPRERGGQGPAIDMEIRFDEDGEAIAVPIFGAGAPVQRQAARVPQTPIAPQEETPAYQEDVASVISFLEEKETKVIKDDMAAFVEEWKPKVPEPDVELIEAVEEARRQGRMVDRDRPREPELTSEELKERWEAGVKRQAEIAKDRKWGEDVMDRLEDIPPPVTDRDWAGMSPEEFQEDFNDCCAGGPRRPSVESGREEELLTAPVDERGYIGFPVDFREKYGEAAVNKPRTEETRIVAVTTNLKGLKPTPKSLSMTDLASVFKSLEAMETVRGVSPGGPGGAFSIEVSDGFWEYLKFTIRDTRGLISLVASQVSREPDITILYASFEEFEIALTQWTALLEIEHRNKSRDVEDLGVELAILHDLIEQLDEAGVLR